MTIQELADAHVGHSEELDEDVTITMQRESFKWGALRVVKEIEDSMPEFAIMSYPIVKIWNKLQELKGELCT